MRENKYKQGLKKRIKELLPESELIDLDPNSTQGWPDILVLYKDRHAFLEVKRSAKAPHRPNQDYYIQKYSEYVYSSFIFPENESEVLDELQRALRS